LNCATGIVSAGSSPDSYFCDTNNLIRGSGEVKNSNFAPVNSLRQSYAYGTNIAFQLAQNGIPIEDILVPLFSSNGQLFQFGCLRVLPPLYPYFICTSKVLDLADDNDQLIIAAYFDKIDYFICESANYYFQFQMNKLVNNKIPFYGLDAEKFFSKNLKNVVGGFFSIFGENNVEKSLNHFFKVMSSLYKILVLRDFIVFPICVHMENEKTKNDTYEIQKCCIIFENLVDYKIGFPLEPQQRLAFIKELEHIVLNLHSAGVIHFDLYLSNIMHKIDSDSGEVKIKLIDFDASIFEWENISEDTQFVLNSRNKYRVNLAHKFNSNNNNNDANYQQKIITKNDNDNNIQQQQNTVIKTNKRDYDLSLIHVMKVFLHDKRLQNDKKNELDFFFS
jgi:hypothetical protein